MMQGDNLSTPVLGVAFAAACRQLLEGDLTTKDLADTMCAMEREALAQKAGRILRHLPSAGLQHDTSRNKIGVSRPLPEQCLQEGCGPG